MMDCYIFSVCKKVFFIKTKQSVVAIVMNGFTSNVITKNENWYCILCAPELLRFCQIKKKMSIPKGNFNKPTDALVNLMNPLNNFPGDE